MDEISDAIEALKRGEIILIHDNGTRENETDMVIAAQSTTPGTVCEMRTNAGGLICVAVDLKISKDIGLPYIADVCASSRKDCPLLAEMTADDIPYDEKSAFSITVNHRKTFTGITDNDRALTISKLGEVMSGRPSMQDFGGQFRTPGHVHLLISSGLENREGHTELSTAILEMAGLTPVAVICEMMDDNTHKALVPDDAKKYGQENGLVFLEARQVKDAYKKFKKEQKE